MQDDEKAKMEKQSKRNEKKKRQKQRKKELKKRQAEEGGVLQTEEDVGTTGERDKEGS